MSTSKEDFDKLGLTTEDWKALVLGMGAVDPLRLDAARAAVARLGGYTAKQASDRNLTDSALRAIATRYPMFWLKGPLTQEEKIRFVQAEKGCSREEAEKHLAQVVKDNEEIARIFEGS